MVIFFQILIVLGVIAIPILVVWGIKEAWKETGKGKDVFRRKKGTFCQH